MADILLSSALSGSSPRRQIVTLTASNASLAIPSWAQGGKGLLLLSGCGAGGGGGGGNSVSFTGASGGGGAWVREMQIPIPSGVSTLSGIIGTGGAGGGLNVAGSTGGSTDFAFGGDAGYRWRFGGGGGGPAASGAAPGAIPSNNGGKVDYGGGTGDLVASFAAFYSGAGVATSQFLWSSSGLPFSNGASGQPLSAGVNAAGIAFLSPWGAGSGSFGGSGLGGAVNTAGGNGGAGLLILEFVEGF